MHQDDNGEVGRPPGQRTEVTAPSRAVAGALVFLVLAVLALAFWPDSSSVHTDATANLPGNQQGTSKAPGSPQ